MALLKIKLTQADLVFIRDTLDSAREEFEEISREEDWYCTDLDERCLTAYNILKYAEKEEVADNATEVE